MKIGLFRFFRGRVDKENNSRGQAYCFAKHLQSKEDQEGDHQTEQTHGLGQGETQNGVANNIII